MAKRCSFRHAVFVHGDEYSEVAIWRFVPPFIRKGCATNSCGYRPGERVRLVVKVRTNPHELAPRNLLPLVLRQPASSAANFKERRQTDCNKESGQSHARGRQTGDLGNRNRIVKNYWIRGAMRK